MLRAVVRTAMAVTALRLLYLVLFCPYSLVEDEAQYWAWSTPEALSLSYYSKGPGVAWAIAVSCIPYQALMFERRPPEWLVRLPAVLAGGVLIIAVGGLARDLARYAGAPARRVARYTVLAVLLIPPFQMLAILMTIDGPLLACWALVCWACWRAAVGGSARAWMLAGLSLGVGFLFKYTIALLVPGLFFAGVMLARRGALHRPRRAAVQAAAALLLAAMCAAPVVIWNARHGWPTLAHLLGHLGVSGGDMPAEAADAVTLGDRFTRAALGPLELIAGQAGMIGPLLLIAGASAWRVLRARAAHNSGADRTLPAVAPLLDATRERTVALFLLIAPAPLIAFYLGVSMAASPEGNWAFGASVTLVPLAAWVVALTPSRRERRLAHSVSSPRDAERLTWFSTRVAWNVAIGWGVAGAIVVHRTDLITAAYNTITPFRPITPGRLIGARPMGEHVTRIVRELREQTGLDPFVMADHYGRASQMMYYARAQVFSASSVMGGRPSHFDFVSDLDLRNLAVQRDLSGRPAVLLSNDKDHTRAGWARLFESVEPWTSPNGSRKLDGEHKRDRVAWIGHGFIPPAPPPPPQPAGHLLPEGHP